MGYETRVRFMHGFPGTMWLQCSAFDLFRQEARVLCAIAGGEQPGPLSIDAAPLAEQAVDDVLEGIRQGQFLRRLLPLEAIATRLSRRVRRGKSADELRQNDQLVLAFLSGDTNTFLAHAHRAASHLPAVGRRVFQALSPAYDAFVRWTHPKLMMLANKLIPQGLSPVPTLFADPSYTHLLLPHLPADACRADAQTKLGKLWRNKRRRSELAPSLACAAALLEAVHRDTHYAYQNSDILDPHHAAYAPLVDIITCDKRSAGPLMQAIKAGTLSTKVVRSAHLDEVVAALQEKVGEHVSRSDPDLGCADTSE